MAVFSSHRREEAAGNRPIAGDEHAVPVLVVLPAGSLQQEDVRGVQAAGGGGRQGGLQVAVALRSASLAGAARLVLIGCVLQVRFGVPVPVLQLRAGEEVQTRHLQGLPGGNHERLRSRSGID